VSTGAASGIELGIEEGDGIGGSNAHDGNEDKNEEQALHGNFLNALADSLASFG
jgi:hypothetical protein